MPPAKGKLNETVEPATAPAPVPEPEASPVPEFPQDIQALGALARQIVGNPAVIAAFDRAIAEAAADWQNTELLDTAKREALYQRVQAIKTLRHHLGQIERAGGTQARRFNMKQVA